MPWASRPGDRARRIAIRCGIEFGAACAALKPRALSRGGRRTSTERIRGRHAPALCLRRAVCVRLAHARCNSPVLRTKKAGIDLAD